MVIDMDLKLNDVLHLTQKEIGNSKIEFNMQAGSGGQPFLDRWLKHTEEEKRLELAAIVLIGVGMENKETSVWGSGYSVSQGGQRMNGC